MRSLPESGPREQLVCAEGRAPCPPLFRSSIIADTPCALSAGLIQAQLLN